MVQQNCIYRDRHTYTYTHIYVYMHACVLYTCVCVDGWMMDNDHAKVVNLGEGNMGLHCTFQHF